MTVQVKRYQNSFLSCSLAVRHILESVYNMPCVKYQYQPLFPFIAELGKKNLFFLRTQWWDIYIYRKSNNKTFSQKLGLPTIKCVI